MMYLTSLLHLVSLYGIENQEEDTYATTSFDIKFLFLFNKKSAFCFSKLAVS